MGLPHMTHAPQRALQAVHIPVTSLTFDLTSDQEQQERQKRRNLQENRRHVTSDISRISDF